MTSPLDRAKLGIQAEELRAERETGRIVALDSLRGLAALSVVFYHCLLIYPALYQVLGGRGRNVYDTGRLDVLLLTASPPSLLWSGREAVLLFFVLSGFVLSLPFMGRRRPRYLPFIVKRACRLILPSIAVVLVVVLVALLIGHEPRSDLSPWFNRATDWTALDPWTVARHLLLIGTEYSLNNVLWTLHYEWHASLLFPVVFAVSVAGLKVAVPAMAVTLAAVIAEGMLVGRAYLATPYFLLYFLFGSLVATQRGWMVAVLHWLPRAGRVVLWLLAYALLKARWLLPYPEHFFDLMAGAGAALLILLILATPRAQALLMRWPLPWLGAISFALYLVHVPTIMAVLQVVPAVVPLPLVLLLAVTLSIGLATLLRRWVERPSIWLGQALSNRLEPRAPDRGRKTSLSSAPAARTAAEAAKSDGKQHDWPIAKQ